VKEKEREEGEGGGGNCPLKQGPLFSQAKKHLDAVQLGCCWVRAKLVKRACSSCVQLRFFSGFQAWLAGWLGCCLVPTYAQKKSSNLDLVVFSCRQLVLATHVPSTASIPCRIKESLKSCSCSSCSFSSFASSSLLGLLLLLSVLERRPWKQSFFSHSFLSRGCQAAMIQAAEAEERNTEEKKTLRYWGIEAGVWMQQQLDDSFLNMVMGFAAKDLEESSCL
jgi:hypothetical protein